MHNQSIPFVKDFLKTTIMRKRLASALAISEIDELKLKLFEKPVYLIGSPESVNQTKISKLSLKHETDPLIKLNGLNHGWSQ